MIAPKFISTAYKLIRNLSLKRKIKRKFHSEDINPYRYHKDVSYVCKIGGKEIIERRYGKLKNDDLVITDERIKHIIYSRGEDSLTISKHLKETILYFDALYDDSESGYENSIIYTKEIENNLVCSIVVSLSLLSNDNANSVITGIMFSTKSIKRYLNSKEKIV